MLTNSMSDFDEHTRESVQFAARALMTSLDVEQEIVKIIVGRNNLRTVLDEILCSCETYGLGDDDNAFEAYDIITNVRRIACNGLMSNLRVG